MQFSKKFMIISMLFILINLVGWRMIDKSGLLNAGDEVETSEEAKQQDDKMQKSFKSLEKMGGKQKPITVEAGPVMRGDLIQTVSAQGRVHAYQQVDITSELSGRLIKLLVKDGDRVKKGQVLAEIDDRDYELALKEAESSLLQAKAEYLEYDRDLSIANTENNLEDIKTRLAGLEKQKKEGLLSEDQYRREKWKLELEEIRSGTRKKDVISARFLDKAEVARDRARINLEKCKLVAPFDGTVFGVEVSPGVMLTGGTVIAKLVNMTDLVIKASVLESEIGQIVKGRKSGVEFTALPELDDIQGKVQAISPFVNEENKTVETIVAFRSNDERIRPGMFAETKIDARIFEDRLMVPKQAILPRDDRIVVFKVSEDNRAKWIYVKTGEENDDYVEITSGDLQPGDMVLTDNHFTMGHDTLVKIAKAKKRK